MENLFTFDDVLIVPKFSDIRSRKDVDISTNPAALPYLRLPIISSNMDTVTGPEMAKAMAANGGIGCLHRFCTIEENVKTFLDSRYGGMGAINTPLVSIGLGKKELERAEALRDAGAFSFVIDVANGANTYVVEQVKELRKIVGHQRHIIVGNFATSESIKDFLWHEKNVDGVKIGIGNGSACTTRLKSGVGIPQLSAIIDVSTRLKNVGLTIVADGGMRNPSDIAKALGAGVHAVMLGGMLAGTDESPGEVIGEPGAIDEIRNFGSSRRLWKKYRGSASKESYVAQGKDDSWRTAEGESFMVPYKGPVRDILQDIEGGLRGSFSSVGARNMKEFHKLCEFAHVSPSTVRENSAHGKNL